VPFAFYVHILDAFPAMTRERRREMRQGCATGERGVINPDKALAKKGMNVNGDEAKTAGLGEFHWICSMQNHNFTYEVVIFIFDRSLLYPNNLKNWFLGRAKTPADQRSQTG